jgi:AcrB/AcrD/AcrF family
LTISRLTGSPSITLRDDTRAEGRHSLATYFAGVDRAGDHLAGVGGRTSPSIARSIYRTEGRGCRGSWFIDSAATDVLAAINAASPYLPVGIPYPPTIRKVNPADTPILVLGLTSETLPLTTVDAFAENILLPKQISGVGLVGLGGQQKPAIRVQVDPQALANRGIGLEDVRNVVM